MQRHDRANQRRQRLKICAKAESPHVNNDVATRQSDAAKLNVSEQIEDGHASTYRTHRNANPSLIDL